MRTGPAPIRSASMHRFSLDPVQTGIRYGLHALMLVLAAIVLVRALLGDARNAGLVTGLTLAFVAVYLGGAAVRMRRPGVWWWLGALAVLWAALVLCEADAAYLVFGLFFLFLHLVPAPWRYLVVVAATAVAIVGIGLHDGWAVGGIIGPLIGAVVAVGIAGGYEALIRQSLERQRLIDELVATRTELAERERAAGVAAERERLAAEIHDTVAQGLSSIQMLLHAAERSDPEHPSREQLVLARETAAQSLTETRRLIADLTPAALAGSTLAQALERLAAQASGPDLATEFVVEGDPMGLPMAVEAALIRSAQGAVANVVRHAQASRMALTLTYADDEVRLDVVDNGVGFDVDAAEHKQGSFGLGALRRRLAPLGGSVSIESEPGLTAVAVSIPITEQEVTP